MYKRQDLYTVISRCNFFLERIDEVMRNEISDDNLEDLEEYTGEVYAIRALCYSELLKNYCKAYDLSLIHIAYMEVDEASLRTERLSMSEGLMVLKSLLEMATPSRM